MMQVPTLQGQQPFVQTLQPSYNAVKIDIHNPQVNAPGAQTTQTPAPVYTAPMYTYPQAPIYEVPKKAIYEEKKDATVTTPIVQEMPKVPTPVVIPPSVIPPKAEEKPQVADAKPVEAVEATPVVAKQVAEIIEEKAPEVKPEVVESKVEAQPAPVVEEKKVADVQPVEIKAPEAAKPKVDLNAFLARLNSNSLDEQASAMESIAEMAETSPQDATELLDVKVIDTLLGIMQKDSSQLVGPSAEQLQIREKILGGQAVTEQEQAKANEITPMEQAERNKQYAIYTVAIMQKLFGSEVEKINSVVVPLTELPGAAGIVEQVKNNSNPMVRASGIDALSYIQRPEYKQDLSTLFSIAQKDADTNVQQAAAKALEKLAQLPEVTAQPQPEVVAQPAA